MSTPETQQWTRVPGTTRAAIHVERLADCPFSFAVSQADMIFPILEGRTNGGVRIPYRELGLPLPGALTHHVAVNFRRQRDRTEAGRVHDEIAFNWNARSHWLPDFHGILRFRIESLRTRVILSGEYQPPLGRVGAVFDRLIGRRLSVATSRDLVNLLLQVLHTRWAAEQLM